MWKGNPHRDNPIKVAVAVIALVLVAGAGVLVLATPRFGWDPLGIDTLWMRHPVLMSSVGLAISAAIFAYDFRWARGGNPGARRALRLSTIFLAVIVLAFICVVLGAHGI